MLYVNIRNVEKKNKNCKNDTSKLFKQKIIKIKC